MKLMASLGGNFVIGWNLIQFNLFKIKAPQWFSVPRRNQIELRVCILRWTSLTRSLNSRGNLLVHVYTGLEKQVRIWYWETCEIWLWTSEVWLRITRDGTYIDWNLSSTLSVPKNTKVSVLSVILVLAHTVHLKESELLSQMFRIFCYQNTKCSCCKIYWIKSLRWYTSWPNTLTHRVVYVGANFACRIRFTVPIPALAVGDTSHLKRVGTEPQITVMYMYIVKRELKVPVLLEARKICYFRHMVAPESAIKGSTPRLI